MENLLKNSMVGLKKLLILNTWVELIAGVLLFFTASLFVTNPAEALLVSLYGIGAFTLGLISFFIKQNLDSISDALKTKFCYCYGLFHLLLPFQCLRFHKIDYLVNLMNGMIWPGAIVLHLGIAIGFMYLLFFTKEVK